MDRGSLETAEDNVATLQGVLDNANGCFMRLNARSRQPTAPATLSSGVLELRAGGRRRGPSRRWSRWSWSHAAATTRRRHGSHGRRPPWRVLR